MTREDNCDAQHVDCLSLALGLWTSDYISANNAWPAKWQMNDSGLVIRVPGRRNHGRPTRNGTTGPPPRGSAFADTKERKRSRSGVAHDLANRPVPEQPRTSRSTAISEHMPPSRYPAPRPVIQALTVADLRNRQGPCSRNSYARTGPAVAVRPLRPAISPFQNWILGDKATAERTAMNRC